MSIKDLNSAARRYYARPNGIILSGRTVVGMSAIQLATSESPLGYITIAASEDNLGSLFVGPSGVTVTSYQLQAGDSLDLEMNDLSKLYVTASIAAQTMFYIALY